MRLLAALLVLVCGAAEARMKAGSVVMSNHVRERVAAADGGPPLDLLPAAAGAYSFRRLKAAGPSLAGKLSRASDSATLDVGFTANGDPDVAAMTTFCTATTCHLATWYDQSGNGRHISNATVAFQPFIAFGCLGGSVCAYMGGASAGLTGPSFTPATGVMSLAAVHKRPAGTNICVILAVNGAAGWMTTRSGVAGFTLAGSAGSINGAINDTVWRSAIGVINGSSSGLTLDGAMTAGTVTGSASAGTISLSGASSTTCQFVELMFWDNVALSGSQISALNTNQHAYWGF